MRSNNKASQFVTEELRRRISVFVLWVSVIIVTVFAVSAALRPPPRDYRAERLARTAPTNPPIRFLRSSVTLDERGDMTVFDEIELRREDPLMRHGLCRNVLIASAKEGETGPSIHKMELLLVTLNNVPLFSVNMPYLERRIPNRGPNVVCVGDDKTELTPGQYHSFTAAYRVSNVIGQRKIGGDAFEWTVAGRTPYGAATAQGLLVLPPKVKPEQIDKLVPFIYLDRVEFPAEAIAPPEGVSRYLALPQNVVEVGTNRDGRATVKFTSPTALLAGESMRVQVGWKSE